MPQVASPRSASGTKEGASQARSHVTCLALAHYKDREEDSVPAPQYVLLMLSLGGKRFRFPQLWLKHELETDQDWR